MLLDLGQVFEEPGHPGPARSRVDGAGLEPVQNPPGLGHERRDGPVLLGQSVKGVAGLRLRRRLGIEG